MTEGTLIDDKSLDVDFYTEVQQKNKKYIRWAIFFAVLNTILYTLVMFEVLPLAQERFSLAFQCNLFAFPIVCFVFGLLLALIPYRSLTWRQKYKRTSLLILLGCDILMTLGLLFIGIAHLYKYAIN